MAARLVRLLVLSLVLGAALPSPAAAALVRLPTSQETATSPVPRRGADPVYASSYFGARYYRAGLGRFTTVDPLGLNVLKLVNPQRFNRYSYANGAPLSYVDSDGRDAAWVNFSNMAMGQGHAGVLSVHKDGTALYSRFGPDPPGRTFGAGKVTTRSISRIKLGSDGLPTRESYVALARELAGIEVDTDPSHISIVYYKTSEKETAALDAYMWMHQGQSDRRAHRRYSLFMRNCGDYALQGLVAGGVVNRILALTSPLAPNALALWLLSHSSPDAYEDELDPTVTYDYTWCVQGSRECGPK